MRHVRLIAISDEYDREPGLAIKGAAVNSDGFMADRPGMGNGGGLIAHDLLEHVNGVHNIGPVWDELEALGGIYQVRGRHGDLMNGRTMHSVETNLAADISRMYQQWLGENDGPNGDTVGRTPHDYDEDFKAAIAIAREEIAKEWPYQSEEPLDLAAVDRYLDLTLRRMRVGFRKAQKKYGTSWNGAGLYQAVRDAVNGCHVDYEGQEFVLSYGNGEAHIREFYNE